MKLLTESMENLSKNKTTQNTFSDLFPSLWIFFSSVYMLVIFKELSPSHLLMALNTCSCS